MVKTIQRITYQTAKNADFFYKMPKAFAPYVKTIEKIIDGKLIHQKVKVTSIYNQLSSDAKLAYTIIRDRLSLSLQSGWWDQDGNVYCIYTTEQLCEALCCKKQKLIKIKKELAEYGLLEEVRRGCNKSNLLFLGEIDHDEEIETIITLNELEQNKKLIQVIALKETNPKKMNPKENPSNPYEIRKYDFHTSTESPSNKEVCFSHFRKYENHTRVRTNKVITNINNNIDTVSIQDESEKMTVKISDNPKTHLEELPTK